MGTRNFAKIPRGISDDRWSCATFLECSLNFPSASYLDIQRMLSGRMTSDFALQRDKDERNGIYSSPKKVISDAILICLVWGACMAQIVLKIAYTFDDWYRWNHAAPSLKKGIQLRSATLTIASDIIYRGYTSLVCPLCNSRNRF